ncbi:MAG: FG-GAP repeat protein, partial [Anaerolineae bacterium]|nr:FG-GAP repeat protein [Anaerolineae bacterium]
MPKNLSILLIASLLMTSLLVSPAPTQAGEQTPTTAPVPTGWWSAVQEDIRQSEYQITWQAATYLPDVPAAYQAPNRAHDLRTYFTPEGAVVIPRVWPEGTDAPSWQLGLGLLGCAGADSLAPDGNRIEYRRDGLREWYVNDEDGLAWHVALFPHPRPPAAGEGDQGGGGEVSLALASPQLTPRLADDGTTVEFLDPAGSTVLHYGPFTAVDAAGRSFPVALDLLPAGPAPGLFTLHVSLLTLPLSTPVTLTTLLSSPTGLSPDPDWSAEGDQLEAHFGSSVSSAGDVDGDGYSDVLVGAFEYDSGYTDEGAAFLYYGSAAGLSLAPGWSASGGQA